MHSIITQRQAGFMHSHDAAGRYSKHSHRIPQPLVWTALATHRRKDTGTAPTARVPMRLARPCRWPGATRTHAAYYIIIHCYNSLGNFQQPPQSTLPRPHAPRTCPLHNSTNTGHSDLPVLPPTCCTPVPQRQRLASQPAPPPTRPRGASGVAPTISPRHSNTAQVGQQRPLMQAVNLTALLGIPSHRSRHGHPQPTLHGPLAPSKTASSRAHVPCRGQRRKTRPVSQRHDTTA